MSTEPLYPTHHYKLWEETTTSGDSSSPKRKRLKNVTWCLGDKPCKTLRKGITWTNGRGVV